MLSRTLLNIALLILVALLAIYVFSPDGKQQENQARTLLTPLSPADVERIKIRHNQRQTELKKENGAQTEALKAIKEENIELREENTWLKTDLLDEIETIKAQLK